MRNRIWNGPDIPGKRWNRGSEGNRDKENYRGKLPGSRENAKVETYREGSALWTALRLGPSSPDPECEWVRVHRTGAGELRAAEQQWNAVATGSDLLRITHIMVTGLTGNLLNGKMSRYVDWRLGVSVLSCLCSLCSLLTVFSVPCESWQVTGPSPAPRAAAPGPPVAATHWSRPDTDQECQEFDSAILRAEAGGRIWNRRI